MVVIASKLKLKFLYFICSIRKKLQYELINISDVTNASIGHTLMVMEYIDLAYIVI